MEFFEVFYTMSLCGETIVRIELYGFFRYDEFGC